jgi:hypothetical protein
MLKPILMVGKLSLVSFKSQLKDFLMRKFPKWLPESIVVHCQAKLDSGALSEDQKQCIIRLTTQDDMRVAWQTLSKVATSSDKLVDLFEYIRLHPAVMYAGTKPHKLTAANQRKVLKEVSLLSERFLSTLSKLDLIEADACKGVVHLESELRRLQNFSASNQDGKVVVTLHGILNGLGTINAEFGIVEMLQTLQEAAKLAMDAPPDGPRKQGAKTATRSTFIKDLKRYVQFHFGRQLNQLVATIVNTAMNLPPETVTEDMVRKA